MDWIGKLLISQAALVILENTVRMRVGLLLDVCVLYFFNKFVNVSLC